MMASSVSNVGSFIARSAGMFVDLVRPMNRVGRLVSVLLLLFLLASWLSSMMGIYSLVTTEGSGLEVGGWAFVVIVSIATTLLMWLMLERTRLPGPLYARIATGLFYVFLLAWTAGFGFSFWWGTLAARADSTRSLTTVLDSLGSQLITAQAQLDAAADNLGSITRQSRATAAQEDAEGGTCGVPSGPGRKKLYQARMNVTADINGQVDAINQGWLRNVRADIAALQVASKTAMAQAKAMGAEQRNQTFQDLYKSARAISQDIDVKARSEAGFAAASLTSTATSLEIQSGAVGFTCFDPQMARQLRFAAQKIAAPIKIQLGEWHPMEGKAATEEGFLRLWGTILGLFGAQTGLGQLQGRDWLPLIIALAVDLGILVLTLSRPRAGGETFLADARADAETQSQLRAILRQHRDAAKLILYDMYFPVRRKHYIAIPDALWSEPRGLDPRSLHVAMAALMRRLAAVRLVNPPRDVLRLAIQRLHQLSWSPQNDIASGAVPKIKEWLARTVRGSTQPDHPVIFEINEIDRNEAICILAEDVDAPVYRGTTSRQRQERAANRDRGERDTPPDTAKAVAPQRRTNNAAAPNLQIPAGQSFLESTFAAAKSLRHQGLKTQAEGMLQAIRAEIPALRKRGLEVLGLDGVEGTHFDPQQPFSVVAEEPSDQPDGTILRVEGLAFIEIGADGKRRVVKEGYVVVAGQRAADSGPEPDASQRRAEAAVNDTLDDGRPTLAFDWLPKSRV